MAFSSEVWGILENSFLSGVPAGGNGDPAVKELVTRGVIDEKGFITSPWQKAFKALSASPFEILLISGAFEQFAVARYYSDPFESGTSFVSAVADRRGTIHFSFPYRIDDIAGLLHGLLDFYGPSAALPIQFGLDFDEFSVLAGFVDAVKTQSIESLQERTPFKVRPVGLEELSVIIEKGLTHNDFRWWVTACQSLAPRPLTVDAIKLGRALQRMVEKKLLSTQNGGYLPSDDGGVLISSLLSPLSFATLSFIGRSPDGTLTLDFVTAVRTATVFWVFNFTDFNDETGKVSVVSSFSMNFFTYITELYEKYRERFKTALISADTAPMAKGKGLTCSQCGIDVSETARFCPNCAAPLISQSQPQLPVDRCSRCGEEIEKGLKFCSNCGTPAEQPDKKVTMKMPCPGCGAMLDSSANFCPGCGKKLDGSPQKAVQQKSPACGKCGTVLAMNARFCRHCGAQRQ